MTAPDDTIKSGSHYDLLRGGLNKHSEEELTKAAFYAMERCPDIIERWKNETPIDSEDERLERLSRLNAAMKESLPDITLTEMARVALFIAMLQHPLSEEQELELKSQIERSARNGQIIRARAAKRKLDQSGG
jgi:hypothetical protein